MTNTSCSANCACALHTVQKSSCRHKRNINISLNSKIFITRSPHRVTRRERRKKKKCSEDWIQLYLFFKRNIIRFTIPKINFTEARFKPVFKFPIFFCSFKLPHLFHGHNYQNTYLRCFSPF